MHRVLITAVVLSALPFSQAQAGPPSYLLLRRASTPQPLHAAEPSGVGYPVQAHGYAYGWFGVSPRVHPERQMGGYRANIDWRFK